MWAAGDKERKSITKRYAKGQEKSIILLALMWWLSAMLTVFAATESQDGVEITVTADRQKYSSDQKIKASVTVEE